MDSRRRVSTESLIFLYVLEHRDTLSCIGMKLPTAIVAVLLLVPLAYSAETPPELVAAKARYQSALAAGSKTARDQYLQDLQKLKSSPKTKKKAALAEAIDAEIKSLNSTNPHQKDGSTLPYGKAVPGRPGFVTSPYEPYKGFIDVHGIAPGTQVVCPYSQKPFLVPEIGK